MNYMSKINVVLRTRKQIFMIFSHTQWVSMTLAIRLCPSLLSLSAWTFKFFDFSQTAARICFKFCVDVPWVDPSSITLNVASCRLEATFNRSTWCCLSQVLERVDRKEHQPSCKISASCSDMTHSIHELDMFYSLNHPVLFFQFAKYFSYRHLKSPLSTFKRFRAAILLVYLVTWHRRFYNWNVLREGRWKRNKQKHTYKSVAVYSVFHLPSQNTFQL